MLKFTRLRAIALACLFALAAPFAFAIDSIVDEATQVYRRYATDGVSASGTHYPNKAEIRALWGRLSASTAALGLVAASDNSTDVTATVQAYVDATPAGGRLHIPPADTCYRITDTITISASMTIEGPMAKFCFTQTDRPAFEITASNVRIDGLYVNCQSSNYTLGNDAFYIHGTRNAGAAPTYITDVQVHRTRVNLCGSAGIRAHYVTKFRATDNQGISLGYACVMMASVVYFDVNGNDCDTLTGDGSGNAYAVSCTRESDDSGNLTSQPYCAEGVIQGNRCANVTTWTCYDGHAPYNVSYVGNVCSNVKSCVEVGTSPNSAGAQTYAPFNAVISGNIASSGVTNGTRRYAYYCGGAATAPGSVTTYARCSITGNRAYGFGTVGTYTNGCIKIEVTVGATIANNDLEGCAETGISLTTDNLNFNIHLGSITDVWANADYVQCVSISSTYNVGYVGGGTCGIGNAATARTKHLGSTDSVVGRMQTDSNNSIALGPYSSTGVYAKWSGTAFLELPTGNGTPTNCARDSITKSADYVYVCTAANTPEKVAIAP